ncbi:MAG: hypothetical protein ACRENP_24310, partial [Longimicrobiales bacterium]
MPLHTLAVLLKERNGAPRHYWRIGTTDNEKERRRYWPVMAASGAMAVGWPAVGDLSKYVGEPRARDAISRLLGKHYNQEDVEARHTRVAGRVMGQLARFLNKVVEGHRVLASDGQTVLGVGEVIGPYRFVESHDFPHQRLVNWRSMKEWKSVVAEGLLTSLATVKDLKNQVETERRILEDAADTVIVIPPTPPP